MNGHTRVANSQILVPISSAKACSGISHASISGLENQILIMQVNDMPGKKMGKPSSYGSKGRVKPGPPKDKRLRKNKAKTM